MVHKWAGVAAPELPEETVPLADKLDKSRKENRPETESILFIKERGFT